MQSEAGTDDRSPALASGGFVSFRGSSPSSEAPLLPTIFDQALYGLFCRNQELLLTRTRIARSAWFGDEDTDPTRDLPPLVWYLFGDLEAVSPGPLTPSVHQQGTSLPDQDDAIGARGRQPVPIGAERDGGHDVGVAVQGQHFLSGFDVPEPDGLILTGCRHPAAIGAECHA